MTFHQAVRAVEITVFLKQAASSGFILCHHNKMATHVCEIAVFLHTKFAPPTHRWRYADTWMWHILYVHIFYSSVRENVICEWLINSQSLILRLTHFLQRNTQRHFYITFHVWHSHRWQGKTEIKETASNGLCERGYCLASLLYSRRKWRFGGHFYLGQCHWSKAKFITYMLSAPCLVSIFSSKFL